MQAEARTAKDVAAPVVGAALPGKRPTRVTGVRLVFAATGDDNRLRPMTQMPVPPSSPAQPATAEPPVVRRGDRVGVWIAWAVIAICTAAIVANVYFSYLPPASEPVTVDPGGDRAPATDAGKPLANAPPKRPAADNPQLTMQAKYAIGASNLLGQQMKSSLTVELRKQARSPNDRLRIIPVIAEIEGKDVAIAELLQWPAPALTPPARTPAATQPAPSTAATTLPATAPASSATASASSPSMLPATRPVPASSQPVVATLLTLYTDGRDALSPQDLELLEVRLGWTGRLAQTWGLSSDESARRQMLAEASRVTTGLLVLFVVALTAGAAGLVLFIIAAVQLWQRRLRLRYQERPLAGASATAVTLPPGLQPGELPSPWQAYRGDTRVGEPSPPAPWGQPPAAPPPWGGTPPPQVPKVYRFGPLRGLHGRTGPFLEAFAIYLAGQVLVSLALKFFVEAETLAWNFVVLIPVMIAVWWPRWRGIDAADVRGGLGWVAPRGFVRECLSGVAGYVAGLPVFFLGVIITLVLVAVSKATPTHPIVGETAGGPWQIALLYLLAAVWAPVVEETFFRGALYHHLRTRWGWLLTALISSLIFAMIHPQGWTMIPGLASLAIVFCAIREWRGSTIGGIIAHALHNGTLVTVMVVMA